MSRFAAKKTADVTRHARPRTRGACRRLIAQIYGEQPWNEPEAARNHAMLGLDAGKGLAEFGEDELRVILADLEAKKMVLFQD